MSKLTPRAAVGKSGERHARLWLEARGYRFVAANWHCQAGELDLVMLDGRELVFIEVKTRTGQKAGHASEAVTAVKGERVLEAAEWFLADHPQYATRVWRCDIIAVTISSSAAVQEVQHFVNAIYED